MKENNGKRSAEVKKELMHFFLFYIMQYEYQMQYTVSQKCLIDCGN